MNRKTFSIIVATYNSGRKVELTIQSVLAQKKDLFELIIIDGASSDDTLDYIKKYERDLTYISEKDGGIYYALNKGIDLATGAYLYFIGAGDELEAGVLERVENLLPPAGSRAFVYGDVYIKDKQTYEKGARSRLSHVARPICHQTIFYDRGIFELVGKYDLRYKISADLALNFKCFGNPQIKKQYIPHLIATFEGGGVSSVTRDPNFVNDELRLIKNNLGIESYIYYKSYEVWSEVYWKLYFPFIRPLVSALRGKKDSGNSQEN